ncbi:MAG: protein kinase [Planctomycetota bacterium JB042]
MEEARRQARLDHANIVSVYGAGSELVGGDITHWLAMQYVEGPSLAELVRSHGPLDPIDATSFVLDAARGLYFVHAEGFIHRDVKPGNVLIDAADRALVADFGVAGDVGSEGDPPTGAPGEFLGTRAYASPEQLAGGRVDVRSDVFSLGATWLFALTAHEPTATGPGGRLPVDPALPPLLRETLERMVAVDVGSRFQSMLECIEALERTLASLTRGSRAPVDRPSAKRRARGRGRGVTVAVASGVALAGTLVWLERSGRAPGSDPGGSPVAAMTRAAEALVGPAPTAEPEAPDPTPADSPPADSSSAGGARTELPDPPSPDVSDPAASSEAFSWFDPRVAEAAAWAEAARRIPGMLPPRLAALEEEALTARDAAAADGVPLDRSSVRLLRACDRIAIELSAAWGAAFDAATFVDGDLEVDRHPITHAQYFEFLRRELAADPSLFLTPLRPLDGDWVPFVDERPIGRPRLALLGRPVAGLQARAAERLAEVRGQRIPDRDEWERSVAPRLAPPRTATAAGFERYERVIWEDAYHFAAVVAAGDEVTPKVVFRDGRLERRLQVLRLVRDAAP